MDSSILDSSALSPKTLDPKTLILVVFQCNGRREFGFIKPGPPMYKLTCETAELVTIALTRYPSEKDTEIEVKPGRQICSEEDTVIEVKPGRQICSEITTPNRNEPKAGLYIKLPVHLIPLSDEDHEKMWSSEACEWSSKTVLAKINSVEKAFHILGTSSEITFDQLRDNPNCGNNYAVTPSEIVRIL